MLSPQEENNALKCISFLTHIHNGESKEINIYWVAIGAMPQCKGFLYTSSHIVLENY